jgi:hypothetical protein
MRRIFFLNLLIFCFWEFSASAQIDLKEGDILFQDGDCGDFCQAIRKVTQGYEGRDFSHNGLLVKHQGQWMVLEATGKGVTLTPLEEFLQRHLDDAGLPNVMVGRLKPPYQTLIPDAIEEGMRHLGKPYDHSFDFTNDAYYCAELIHFAFRKANGGSDLFEPQPMTYIDPDTGETFGIWKDYFDALAIPVPEGKPGLNPGGMSRAEVLEMKKLEYFKF